MIQHDITNKNEKVISKKQIDSILNTFRTIGFIELDKDYLTWTKSNVKKYRNTLKTSRYRIIRRNDFYKKIVGNFRIRDFACRDSIYRKCLFDPTQEFYWLIDKKLLYAILDLQRELAASGYNSDQFWIRYGHRHPKKNEAVRGADMSKHINGQAVDLAIQDIDGNGRYTESDKAVVLDLAENKIIKDKGGVGRYPGTRTVHIDVRGYRARWDGY